MPDVILRTGKVFEAGDFPDKNFSLSEDELAEAAAEFEPVDVDLEHVPTVLSGKLGKLRALEARGKELFGSVELPEWLHKLLGEEPLKVSCTWDRATKRLAGLALVRTPRIADAALMSAFAEFAGKRHSAADVEALQQIHDLTVGQGAACKAEMGDGKMPDKPSLLDRLRAAFKKSGEDEALADDLVAEFKVATPPPAEDPRVKALEDQLALFRAEQGQQRELRFSSDATAFARLVGDRIFPSEVPALVALFVQAARDDAAVTAQVTFAEGKTGSRLDALKHAYTQRPKHGLTAELAQGKVEGLRVIFDAAEPPTDAMSEARRKQLLGMTPLGEAVCAANGKGDK